MLRHFITATDSIALLSACRSASPTADVATRINDATQGSIAAGASPWQQAGARGVAFRGVGTEPGWPVEVDQGETPALRAELKYAERNILVARAQALSGVEGYADKADDGSVVPLHLQRVPCSDGMSDETYPVTARLTVPGKTYRGCGRFLAE